MPFDIHVVNEMTSEKHKHLFCSRPFQYLEVASKPRGKAFLCCPSWLPVSTGIVGEDSVEEVWNGKRAQAVRESILDGSFRFCNAHCPFLQTVSGPVQEIQWMADTEMLDIVRDRRTVVLGPKVVNAAFDRSCNLSCPTCRTEHLIEREASADIRKLQSIVESEVLPNAELLYVTGSGDAFGSPFFLAWLRSLRVCDKPRLRIHLHTNAQLWTPNIWAKISADVRERIVSAEISIDAASSGTYQLNRRGGDWETLLQNLKFISGLRAQGPLTHLILHMLVQENNFYEVPGFVELGNAFCADQIYFSHLAHWGTFSREELRARSIHLPGHPKHEQFLEVLKHPSLRSEKVDLGNLSKLTEGWQSQVPGVKHKRM